MSHVWFVLLDVSFKYSVRFFGKRCLVRNLNANVSITSLTVPYCPPCTGSFERVLLTKLDPRQQAILNCVAETVYFRCPVSLHNVFNIFLNPSLNLRCIPINNLKILLNHRQRSFVVYLKWDTQTWTVLDWVDTKYKHTKHNVFQPHLSLWWSMWLPLA